VRAATEIPLLPNTADFLPIEESTGPSDTAESDALSAWTYERGDLDIAAHLAKTEQTRNKQADGFTSSVPDEGFVAGARRYFEAHHEFWERNAPDFYEQVITEWHDANVAPVLLR
jgi:hypothetical protein